MNGTSQKQQIFQDLKKLILSKTSIVYLLSDEEDRVESLFKELIATFQPKPKLCIWNPFYGLVGENERIENTKNPIDALDKVIQRSEQAFYLFEGLHPMMQTDPLISRKLKDVHRSFRNRYATLFIIAPILVVPEELRRDMIIDEKGQLIKKSGILNYVTNIPTVEEIGGLENLKDWLRKRSQVLSSEGKSFGLQLPKGVLITGLSGCGKSLCAKVFASFWPVPLLHLDMARLYEGTIGEPEEALQVSLRTAESVAPCVLWFDEIEGGIIIQSQKAGGGG